MTITRIEQLTYGVEDIQECERYLEDWALEKIEGGSRGATYRTLENQLIVLRLATDDDLPVAVEAGCTVREITWGIDNRESLDAIGGELEKDRPVIAADGALHAFDETGIPIAFRVADPTPVETAAVAANFQDKVLRRNRRIDHIDRVKPMSIGHVVFGIPKKDREAATSFYVDRLNFRFTDRVTGMGDFMRPDGLDYHHVWFLAHRGDKVALNHVAYEVKDFEEIVIAGKYMKAKGWSTSRNPGRHNLGSNLHWYFKCPLGGEMEYFADMDRMDDDWEVRVWDEPPEINFWKAEIV